MGFLASARIGSLNFKVKMYGRTQQPARSHTPDHLTTLKNVADLREPFIQMKISSNNSPPLPSGP